MNLVSCAKLDAELAEKQDKLLNCAGAPIPADTRIPTCEEMQDELDKKLDKPIGGTDGQVLTIQPDGSAAWETPASGGTGTTELADGVTILGTGTSADKLRVARPIPSGGTSGQVPALKPDGTLEWITPASGGTGTTELADGVTILGVGTSANKFRVARPVPLGGVDGQALVIQADGSLAWETISGGTGGITPVADYPSTDDTKGATAAYVNKAVNRAWYFRAQI